jgi:hypothetical protein
MANWHALTGSSDGNSFRIVFHIAIPSANNRVGINYQVAMINSWHWRQDGPARRRRQRRHDQRGGKGARFTSGLAF